jgi:hypothetical protein
LLISVERAIDITRCPKLGSQLQMLIATKPASALPATTHLAIRTDTVQEKINQAIAKSPNQASPQL